MRAFISLMFSLCCSAGVSVAQSSVEDVFQLSGLMIDRTSGAPIPQGNIIDLNTGRGVTTDLKGFFSLVVRKRDSVQFSTVGFKTQTLIVPDTLTRYLQSVAVRMVRDTIQLEPAYVFPWPDQGSFRKAFVEIQLQSPEDQIAPYAGFHTVENPQEPAPSVMNPASFIYDKIVKPIKKNKRKRKKSRELPKMGGG